MSCAWLHSFFLCLYNQECRRCAVFGDMLYVLNMIFVCGGLRQTIVPCIFPPRLTSVCQPCDVRSLSPPPVGVFARRRSFCVGKVFVLVDHVLGMRKTMVI